MAQQKRSSLVATQNTSTRELKQRVFTCLNKLSDRDTHSVAATELECIARNLTHDSFSPFIASVSSTDQSDKSPVRKQCVRILGFLSEAHGDDLSPFLTKMISAVVRRLRDPDSAVRSACIDAVATMSSQITKPPFSLFVKYFTDTLVMEQDYSSQIGSALCLASAIDASPDPDPSKLQKLLPRLVKLMKSESFKAKPALLTLVGSIIAAGGASSCDVLRNLIPCMVEFLSSEDWAARKAAAEAFGQLAVVERILVSEFKTSCLRVFENRRFDKVKVVRDTMNQMIDAWKEIPDVSDDVSPPLQSRSSSRENASDGQHPARSKESSIPSFKTLHIRKQHDQVRKSLLPDSSSATTARKNSPVNTSEKKESPPIFRKLDRKKPSNWKVEIAIPRSDDPKGRDGRILEGQIDSNGSSKQEARRMLFSRSPDDKMGETVGLRSGSRVAPYQEEISGRTFVVSNGTGNLYKSQKECEDLSSIRRQLVQIENQQSSLLDLLQKFMGSSQNGMHSLETRVHGLEQALDEISYDLAASTGKMPNTDSAGTACCRLPGADFLSSKFRRRTEGRYSTSRFSTSSATPFLSANRYLTDRSASNDAFKIENSRFRLHRGGGSGFIVNPLAEIHNESNGISEVSPNTIAKNVEAAA